MRLPEIRIWDRGWNDRRWKKGLKRATPEQREALEQAIVDLVAALMECKHPHLDPEMQRWGPTKWHVPRQQQRQGDWYEYRLGDRKNAARVVVCHDAREQVIYLVARTAVHDHARMERLVREF